MDFTFDKSFKHHRIERTDKLGFNNYDYGYEGILYKCLPKILFKGTPALAAFLQMIDMRLILMFKTIDKIKNFKNIPIIESVTNNPIDYKVDENLKKHKYYIEFVLDEGIDYFVYDGKRYYKNTKFKIRKDTEIFWETECKYGFRTRYKTGKHIVKGDDTIYLKSRRNHYDVSVDYEKETPKYDVNISYDKEVEKYDISINYEKEIPTNYDVNIDYEKETLTNYDISIDFTKEK
ncbi:MAG: hypothetical protein J1F35_06115 [Erysipelotrichales bacterium]|nr:hypothetical protein [Erysipelotrichales bacterium]